MKLHIGPNTVIAALLAALLLSAAACSDRNAQARLAMAAADSLMTADPQAALDTLKTIDSSDASSLPRADRAFYTLLRTEAEYKCWLPVAEYRHSRGCGLLPPQRAGGQAGKGTRHAWCRPLGAR